METAVSSALLRKQVDYIGYRRNFDEVDECVNFLT